MKQRAVFIDRDGTLVHPRHYPSRPDDLRLYDGITPGLRDLQKAGFRLVVITNQSGIARGYFTEEDLQRMHDYLSSTLESEGVRLDAIYYCPHHTAGIIPELAIACDCRKPRPGLLLRAAADLDLELGRCWFMGDILDDVEAGNRAGCRTILVDLGTEQAPSLPLRWPDFVARSTRHALNIIKACEFPSSPAGEAIDCAYRPARWSDRTPGRSRSNHSQLARQSTGAHHEYAG